MTYSEKPLVIGFIVRPSLRFNQINRAVAEHGPLDRCSHFPRVD